MEKLKPRLFFYYISFKEDSIYSKISDQIQIFCRYYKNGLLDNFQYTHICEEDFKHAYLGVENNSKQILFLKNKKMYGKLLNYLVSIRRLQKITINYLVDNNFTHIYIRRAYTDYNFIKFLSKLNKAGIRIIYEIPTYPYDGEMNKRSLMYKIDLYYRKKLKNYVERIVTFSKHKKIFSIKTICTINGVDTASYLKKEKKKNSKNTLKDEINLIAVAGMHEWHGYERLIKGMAKYYKNNGKIKIIFHVVGGNEENNNSELVMYKKLVEINNLKNYVFFYGQKFDLELDEIYDKADIAVSSLGFYKIGLDTASSIKTKEYALRGLPMITTSDLEFLPSDYKYILVVPNNPEIINVNDIVGFYKKNIFKKNKRIIVNELVKYTVDNCDMYKTMLPIINYLNEGEYAV